MKRFHVHVNVSDLDASIRFYSQLFAAEPAVVKDDYAKWMLDDPRLNFAISQRERASGVDHLGLQAEDAAELAEIGQRLAAADAIELTETDTTCCYARSDKYWVTDPAGVAWESFHSLGTVPFYNGETKDAAKDACCVPSDPAAAQPACCG
jgi:catechol 2,3-dioxygenase-like lactoylglutathione lyase family enzyme